MQNYQVFRTPPQSFDTRFYGSGCYCECQGKLLFLKRHPEKRDGGTWCIPGGGGENGETPAQTVIRELFEEIGIHVEPNEIEPLSTFYIRLPELEYIFHTFRMSFAQRPSITLALDEHTEARWVSVEEAMQLPLIRGGRESLTHYISEIR